MFKYCQCIQYVQCYQDFVVYMFGPGVMLINDAHSNVHH